MFAKLSLLLFAGLFAASAASARDLITREIPWDGSESLVIDVPADVRFVQTAASPGRVLVTGPRRSVETVRCEGGVLRDRRLRTGAQLQIVVLAPRIIHFVANGGDTLTIERFDQDTLQIETTGRADIKAAGRAGTITLKLQGFGWADLTQLDVQGADIALTGSRRVLVAPAEWAKLSGNGVVILLTPPATLSHDLRGAGRVIHAHRETPAPTASRFPVDPEEAGSSVTPTASSTGPSAPQPLAPDETIHPGSGPA